MVFNKTYYSKKWLALLLMISLSGCSAHRQLNNPYPVEKLKKLNPQYVTIHGGYLEYYRFGNGSPIVLIPGYVTDVSSWNRQFLATLGKQHQVIVFNNRNVGGSYVHSNHHESADLANDTYQLIRQLHLHKPAVLGISMGGMIAQQLAVLHPKTLGQLILINTAIAGKQAVRPTQSAEEFMLNMPTNKLGRYIVALKLFFPSSERLPMGLALALDRFQPQNYTEINASTVISQQRTLVTKWIHDDATAVKISKLHLPVLILNGGADDVIPPVNSIILARTIPHARLKRWQNGGHAMIYQYPEEIGRSVNDFIAGISI